MRYSSTRVDRPATAAVRAGSARLQRGGGACHRAAPAGGRRRLGLGRHALEAEVERALGLAQVQRLRAVAAPDFLPAEGRQLTLVPGGPIDHVSLRQQPRTG